MDTIKSQYVVNEVLLEKEQKKKGPKLRYNAA